MSLQDHFEQIAKQEMERRAREIEQATIAGFVGGLELALAILHREQNNIDISCHPHDFVENVIDVIHYYITFPSRAEEFYE